MTTYYPAQPRPREQPKKKYDGLLLCTCGQPMTIAGQRDKTIVCRCSSGIFCPDGYEAAYTDDHPFFNHPQAMTKVGDTIILPSIEWLSARAQGGAGTGTGAAPPPKTYHCKTCPAEIDEKQAKSSFDLMGKALCQNCLGKALGC